MTLWAVAVIVIGFSLPATAPGGGGTPPAVKILEPLDGATVSGLVDISGEARDDGNVTAPYVFIEGGAKWLANDTSGNGTWFTWATAWDSTGVYDGAHTITGKGLDNNGTYGFHQITVHTKNGNVKNGPPWAKIVSPPGGSTVRGNVTLKILAGDPDPGDAVELVQVKVPGSDWQNATDRGNGTYTFEWDTSTAPEGWVKVCARAFDGELYSYPHCVAYYVDNKADKDNTEPFVKIENPNDGEFVSGLVLVHGFAKDPDYGDKVEAVYVRIDNGSWQKATDTSGGDFGTWAYQWDTSKESEGKHTVCAKAFDGELYSDLHCITVTVGTKNRPPKVAIVHPKDGQYVSGIVLIHGTASDDVAVKAVFVRIGDGWQRAVDTSPDGSWATWAYEWDTTKLPAGCYLVQAKAWDGSLLSDIASVKACVKAKDGKPGVKITYPEDGALVKGAVTVKGLAMDDVRVKAVEVRIDFGAWQPAADTSGDGSFSSLSYSLDTTNESEGDHKISARAFDGTQHSDARTLHVIVKNDGTKGGSPVPMAAGLIALLAAVLGGRRFA